MQMPQDKRSHKVDQIITEHAGLITSDVNNQQRQQEMMNKLPKDMASHVAQMMLLYGVSFAHLVPDWRMLPPDSLRFFQIDANWLDALIDGAFSVGIQSKRDTNTQDILTPIIRLIAERAAPKLRPVFQEDDLLEEQTLVNEEATKVDEPPQVDWCGFLLRSPVVSGFPGLEIIAYSDEDETVKIPMLRLERLAPDIMIGIMAELPKRIVVYEPAEALHFGVTSNLEVDLRAVADGEALGRTVPTQWRQGSESERVLDINQLVQMLQNDESVPTDKPFGPSQFALQMISTASKKTFKREDS